MWRKRETIKRWHKAFIWALLAGVAKTAVAGAKLAGGAALKGAKMLGKGVADTAWKAGEKTIGAIVDPAEKAFNAFKEGGAKAGLKQVGEELIKGTDVAKKIDLIKGVGDFITPEAQAATGNKDITADAEAAIQAATVVKSPEVPKSTFNKAFLDEITGKQTDLSTSGRMANLGGTIGEGLKNRMFGASDNTATESYTASYRSDIVALASKGIEGFDKGDWDELRDKYPTNRSQIDELEIQYTPVKTNPEFKDEGGIGAWMSKHKAKVTPKAKSMIDAIKSEGDLQVYKDSVADKIKADIWKGSDHKILREYYGF